MEVHIGTKDMEIGKVSLKIRFMSLSKLTWKCSLSLANKHAHIKPFNFDSIKKGAVNIIRMCHCFLGRALNIIKLMHCIGKGNGLIKLPFLFYRLTHAIGMGTIYTFIMISGLKARAFNLSSIGKYFI